jgi:hypothetical protein
MRKGPMRCHTGPEKQRGIATLRTISFGKTPGPENTWQQRVVPMQQRRGARPRAYRNAKSPNRGGRFDHRPQDSDRNHKARNAGLDRKRTQAARGSWAGAHMERPQQYLLALLQQSILPSLAAHSTVGFSSVSMLVTAVTLAGVASFVATSSASEMTCSRFSWADSI